MTGPCARASRWALAALAGAALLACGGTSAQEVLDATASNLAKIRSGDLRLVMTASAGAGGEERPVGFEVAGAFATARQAGELPVARLRRTRVVGTSRESTTFVSTGRQAFLVVDGKAYEVPEPELEGLRAAEGSEEEAAGLARLEVAEWARSPEVADAGRVGGAPVQRVTAEVDVAKALSDVVAVANQVGASPSEGLAPIDADGAKRLERAVRSARLEVLTGKEDRLLRRLRLDVTFAPEDLGELEAALGRLAGSRLHLEIELSGFNRKVDVDPPAGARPLSELGQRP